MLVVSPEVASSSGVLVVEGETNLAPRRASGSGDSAEGDSTSRVTPISACPPNCAEMKEMLGHIPRAFDADLPSLKMFETVEMVLLHSFTLSVISRCALFSRYLTSLLCIFCCNW